MFKLLIVETSKVSKSSTIAHVRNSIELYNYLSRNINVCELVDLTEDIDLSVQWDLILFSYASMGANYDKMKILIDNQKSCRVGWITNEFELFANDFVKKRMDFMINNFDASGIKKAHTYKDLHTTNLNLLLSGERNKKTEKLYNLCYYGTYRKYRDDYFKKYFNEDLILSTTKKNWKKFIDININESCLVTDKFSWVPQRETLNLFKASLYIEDTKTHTCFNHLANRFFESLQCNTAMFFDESCRNTINNDIYEIDEYFIVNSSEEIKEKIKNLDSVRVEHYLKVNTDIAKIERGKMLKGILVFLNDLVIREQTTGRVI